MTKMKYDVNAVEFQQNESVSKESVQILLSILFKVTTKESQVTTKSIVKSRTDKRIM